MPQCKNQDNAPILAAQIFIVPTHDHRSGEGRFVPLEPYRTSKGEDDATHQGDEGIRLALASPVRTLDPPRSKL